MISLKWHMPIWEEICRAEQKYMPFLGPWPSAFSGKNPKHRNIYKSSQCCALDFFPQNTLGGGPAFWILFPRRIRVKISFLANFESIKHPTSWFHDHELFYMSCASFLFNELVSSMEFDYKNNHFLSERSIFVSQKTKISKICYTCHSRI